VPSVRILGTGAEWADGSEMEVASILRSASDVSAGSDELAGRIRDWPTRYHFSRLRANLLAPLRIGPGKRVLDLGGGTGTLSRRLGELGADVLLLDGSRERAVAASARCAQLPNVEVAVGTVFDLDEREERFDVVLIVGLLEYAQQNPGGPEGLLRNAAALLAPDGVVAVAIENAIGLKYLLGYAEDHLDRPWVGLEGYPGIDHVRTYSRRELAAMLTAAGLPEQAWYAPFPDYKLPTVIVSDAAYALDDPDVVDAVVSRPCSTEASRPTRIADERGAHLTMLRAGLGPAVANSFFVAAGRSTAALDRHADQGTLAWLTGAERRARFMRNRRLVSDRGTLEIVDDSAEAVAVEEGWLTQRRYPRIPFERGRPLDQLLVEALATRDPERIRRELALWADAVREHAFTAPEQPDNPFGPEQGALALPGGFLDSQPSNFVQGDDGLRRIDAEWEARGAVDFDLVAVRGLLYFALDIVARGIATPAPPEAVLSTVIAALADAAGIEGARRALERLPAAEAALQGLVLGVPSETVEADLVRRFELPALESARI
jgi:2-polyprenyl-3-methyl-5-hydroxy-6-metoxy-1,4-benzoquinol methylase